MSYLKQIISLINDLLEITKSFSKTYENNLSIVYLLFIILVIITIAVVYIAFGLHVFNYDDHSYYEGSKIAILIAFGFISISFIAIQFFYALGKFMSSDDFQDNLTRLSAIIIMKSPILLIISLYIAILNLHYNEELPIIRNLFLFGGIFIIPIVFVLFFIYNISYILYNNITENREECKALIFASFYSLFMGLIIFILEKFIYFTMTIYKKKLTCDSSKNDSICSWNIPPHNDFYHNGVLGYHIPVFIVSLLFFIFLLFILKQGGEFIIAKILKVIYLPIRLLFNKILTKKIVSSGGSKGKIKSKRK
jgi:hypothetical protein